MKTCLILAVLVLCCFNGSCGDNSPSVDNAESSTWQYWNKVKGAAVETVYRLKGRAQIVGEVAANESTKAWSDIKQAWDVVKESSISAYQGSSIDQMLKKYKFVELKDSDAVQEFDSTLLGVVESTYAYTPNVSVIKFEYEASYNGCSEALDWSVEQMAKHFKVSNEGALKFVKITAIAASGAVVVYFIAPLVLPAVGFTAKGVSAGSLASSVQSVFYGGNTAGLFSALQSAGALGISTSTKISLALVTEKAVSLPLEWYYGIWN